VPAAAAETASDAITPRQQQVLGAALALLVELGDRLTMTAVARRASCSKETLYKWFGGRDGLLAATVQWQAAKVRAPRLTDGSLDRASLNQNLRQFAEDLLRTIAGETSIALNRLAMTHAAASAEGLGAIMLAHGPAAIRRRLIPLLEAGRRAGLLSVADAEDAYRTFFGLVVRDTQVRLLLGEALPTGEREIAAASETAVAQFFALFGAHR
jgi:AcrR family transcriptional regulator